MTVKKGISVKKAKELILAKEEAMRAVKKLYQITNLNSDNVLEKMSKDLKFLEKAKERAMSKSDYQPETKFVNDKRPTLEECQRFVEGYVQMISLNGGRQMLVNEEAYIIDSNKMVKNDMATELAKRSGVIIGHKGILGNAIVLSGDALWT